MVYFVSVFDFIVFCGLVSFSALWEGGGAAGKAAYPGCGVFVCSCVADVLSG